MRYGPGSSTRTIVGTIVLGSVISWYAPWSSVMCTRRPSTSPSSVMAASTSSTSSRACPAARRFSLRSSIHATGRPTTLAAAHTATSSRLGYAFWPNEPPMSRHSTLTRLAGRSSSDASASRSACGF